MTAETLTITKRGISSPFLWAKRILVPVKHPCTDLLHARILGFVRLKTSWIQNNERLRHAKRRGRDIICFR